MKIEEIIGAIKPRKGANLSVVFDKTLKTRKGVSEKVTKVTRIIVRGGCEYDNLAVVQEGRESGELPAENAGLPWGEWAEFPLWITHKGTDYVRVYPASGVNIATGEPFKPEVTFYVDGVETPKAQVQALCLASEFPKRDSEPLCFTVKADNVREITL